ncbi:MAG: HAD-IA family hydrolase [Ilumatobacter sp.]|uniref:HAD-IA family hydrolase n=1 Tax=Ilumatobacter sp. TaxID=1967498 RepID=UPI002607A8B6|nr:HAD-IA family hydrolase [Ilumatobacter sp.]MDJ0769875.1 HAD-IA family hydrolase [Ilumatobacter sp.]
MRAGTDAGTGAGPITLRADAVLFDSDGVLVDSHARVLTAWAELARRFGLDFEAMSDEIAGVPADAILRRHLPATDVDDAVATLEDLEVAAAAATTPIAGATDLLLGLPTDRWAIVTSASRRLATARWSAAGIPATHVVTADDVVDGKPHPEPFLRAAAALGVEASRCVVFEDSAAGAVAAEAAGATIVAVGDRPWAVPPAARVPDLESVTITVDPVAADGPLTVVVG